LGRNKIILIMNINEVEILENLTDPSRDTKELLQEGDQIKILENGAVITCYYENYESYKPEEEE